MTEHERKLAKADAYLRKIQPKATTLGQQRMKLVYKKEKVGQLEKDMEMSQLSTWTAESQYNIDAKEKEILKRKRQTILSEITRTGLPDREQLIDTIVALRVEKNHHEEETRMLKVSCARLKKQLVQALEQTG